MQYVYQFIDFSENKQRAPPRAAAHLANLYPHVEEELAGPWVAGQDLCQMAADQISCG